MSSTIKNMSFEEALAELEAVVRQLESGKVKLDEAVAAYERGVKLKELCADRLQKAQSRIDKLVLDKTGAPAGLESFDVQHEG
ncbi:MAG: exodeoxyribonuclease VII small subunit [Alphaproteobacteria bacterium]|nr:exodeoxyribonuclease VII small subunit [Alphaproteobacteria bacterium]